MTEVIAMPTDPLPFRHATVHLELADGRIVDLDIEPVAPDSDVAITYDVDLARSDRPLTRPVRVSEDVMVTFEHVHLTAVLSPPPTPDPDEEP